MKNKYLKFIIFAFVVFIPLSKIYAGPNEVIGDLGEDNDGNGRPDRILLGPGAAVKIPGYYMSNPNENGGIYGLWIEVGSVGGSEESSPPPPACNDCSLPVCPAPLTSKSNGYFSVRTRSCKHPGDCTGPRKTGKCYPIPENEAEPISSIKITLNNGTIISNNPLDKYIGKVYAQTGVELGYTSLTYTGKSLNNPIHVTSTYSDPDGVDDLEALYVWFSYDNDETHMPRYILQDTTQTPKARNNTFGFMLHKEGNAWVAYVPSYLGKSIDKYDADYVWTKATYIDPLAGLSSGFYIYGPNSLKMIQVSNISLSGTDQVTIDCDMNFLNDLADTEIVNGYWGKSTAKNKSTGSIPKYNSQFYVYAYANDVFRFTPRDNYPNDVATAFAPGQIQSYILNYGSVNLGRIVWNIDLEPPTYSTMRFESTKTTNLFNLRIKASDTEKIYAIIIDASISFTEPEEDGYDEEGALDIPELPEETGGDTTGGDESGDGSVEGASTGYSITYKSLSQKLYKGIEKTYLLKSPENTKIGDLTDSSHLFVYENYGSTSFDETIQINIANLDGGRIFADLTIIDYAGNVTRAATNKSFDEWIASDGGLVYAQKGISFDVPNLKDSSWGSGRTDKILENSKSSGGQKLTGSKIDVSTEALIDGNEYDSVVSLIKSVKNESYRLSSADIANTESYFDGLYASYQSRIAEVRANNTNTVFEDTFETLTLDNKLSSVCGSNCTESQYYLTVKGDLNISSDFVCDNKGIIFVGGNIHVKPDVLNSKSTDACIFISRKRIYIYEGNVSSTIGTPTKSNTLGYDIINGYFISDGNIYIVRDQDLLDSTFQSVWNPAEVTAGKSIGRSDGLIVNGGLVSLNSIRVDRSLNILYRLLYPALIVRNNSKYGMFSQSVLGGSFNFQKSEVGFKPY